MSKKNRRKKKKQIIKYERNDISESRMVEILAEAYYRALKKIEKEKLDYKEQMSEKVNDEGSIDLLFILNVVLFPWKIHKKFSVNNRIYDSILVLFVSGVLKIIGTLIWLVGFIAIIVEIYHIATIGITATLVTALLIEISSVLLGSILVLAGTEFSKEMDSNKIYAYSASIIALISCVVGIIALLKTQ